MLSRKINFSARVPSKDTLKLAISEGIVHFCEQNLQKGVDKYTFKRFIGRGTKFFHNFSKSCSPLSLPIQSKRNIEQKRNAQFLAYRELCIFVNKYF